MLALLVCGPHVRENCCKENRISLLRTHRLVLPILLSKAREHDLFHGLLSADPLAKHNPSPEATSLPLHIKARVVHGFEQSRPQLHDCN